MYSYCLCTQRMIFQSQRVIVWQCYHPSQAKKKKNNQAATIQKLAVKKKSIPYFFN